MRKSKAEVIREYGPFPDCSNVGGVSFDGKLAWFAKGDALQAFDPDNGEVQRSHAVAAKAGTAYDGRHLFQLADGRIQKIDPQTGTVLATIPAPGGGGDSGMAWADGTLWVGQYRRAEDPPGRSRDGRDTANHRIESPRDRRHLGGSGTVARHLGRRGERVAPHRPAQR